MKIFISFDMEGISGISSWSEMESASRGAFCVERVHQELTWIIDELFRLEDKDGKNGIEEICICDSHSRGENLLYKSFGHERITHIKGYPRQFYMMQGLDATFDAVFLVGYHAKIGSQFGIMDHSYSSACIYAVRINGKEVGEVEINAFYAGMFNVPIALISGDNILEQQAESFFKGHMPYVCTKEGMGRFAGKMYSPEHLRHEFQQKVNESISILPELELKKLSGTIELEIDLVTTVVADAVSIIPSVIRKSGRTIQYSSENYQDIFRMILTTAMLGGSFSTYK